MNKTEQTKRARLLMAAMDPVPGETRQVSLCVDCDHIYGRRFIPFGLGYGATFNPCHCMVTNNHQNRTTKLLMEKND